LRRLPKEHPEEFLRYRGTTARDFLAEMRRFARTLNPRALVTANNSLNSPEVLYSQCRSYGYNIYEMSQAEDFVVVEDMSSQPRLLPDGRFAEYGPTYKQLQAICHGRPIVAVTIADGDYHTPPNLVRLAMAEAAAHSASYLSWATWPEKERQRMIEAIRPESDFLRANVQFKAFDEDDFRLEGCKVLLASSSSDFTKAERERVDKFVARGGKLVLCDLTNWLAEAQTHIGDPVDPT
jgi:hypothetical protein